MNNMGEQSLANLHSRENLQIWLVRLEGCPPVGSVVVGGSREFFNSESFSDAKCPFLIVMGLRSLFYFNFFSPSCPPKKNYPCSQFHTGGWTRMRVGWERLSLPHRGKGWLSWERGSTAQHAVQLSACLQELSLSMLEASGSVCGIPCSSLSACASQLRTAASLRQKQWSCLTLVPAANKPCICASRIKLSGALSVLIRITARVFHLR